MVAASVALPGVQGFDYCLKKEIVEGLLSAVDSSHKKKISICVNTVVGAKNKLKYSSNKDTKRIKPYSRAPNSVWLLGLKEICLQVHTSKELSKRD